MEDSLIPLIIGMAAVTYGPRLAPFLLLTGRPVPRRVNLFLKYIPAAAIGALLLPGTFSATPDLPAASVAGIGCAVAIGLVRGGIILPVLGAVAATYLVLLNFA